VTNLPHCSSNVAIRHNDATRRCDGDVTLRRDFAQSRHNRQRWVGAGSPNLSRGHGPPSPMGMGLPCHTTRHSSARYHSLWRPAVGMARVGTEDTGRIPCLMQLRLRRTEGQQQQKWNIPGYACTSHCTMGRATGAPFLSAKKRARN
jgi:hypothetical protein